MKQSLSLVTLCLILASPAALRAGKTLLHQDFQALLTPFSLGLVALGGGAAGLARQWDGEVEGKMGKNVVFEGALELADLYGTGACGLAATL